MVPQSATVGSSSVLAVLATFLDSGLNGGTLNFHEKFFGTRKFWEKSQARQARLRNQLREIEEPFLDEALVIANWDYGSKGQLNKFEWNKLWWNGLINIKEALISEAAS